MRKRYLLAVDPSTTAIGLALFDIDTGEYVTSWVWKLKGVNLLARVMYLANMFDTFEPDGDIYAVAIETQYIELDDKKGSISSGMKVVESKGWVLGMIELKYRPTAYIEYAPIQWKEGFTGNPYADKEAVIRFCEMTGIFFTHINPDTLWEHAADAVGIGTAALPEVRRITLGINVNQKHSHVRR